MGGFLEAVGRDLGMTAQECNRMRSSAVLAILLLAMSGVVAPASAKGCLKGAIVGGVAGHYAGHHGVLGAAAGCLIGRHYAHKHARAQQHVSGSGRF